MAKLIGENNDAIKVEEQNLPLPDNMVTSNEESTQTSPEEPEIPAEEVKTEDSFKETSFDIPQPKGDKFQELTEKFRKNKRTVLAIAGAVLLVIIVAFVIINSDGNKYNRGVSAFEKGEYEKAQEIFTKISDYEDAQQWANDSATMIRVESKVADEDYNGALTETDQLTVSAPIMHKYRYILYAKSYDKDATSSALTLSGSSNFFAKDKYNKALCLLERAEKGDEFSYDIVSAYAAASSSDALIKEYYKECKDSDDEEIATLAEHCWKGLQYADAITPYTEGDYDKAAKAFDKLGDFENAADMAQQCKNIKKEKEAAYKEGEKLLKENKNYQAYKKFKEAVPYSDAEKQMESCKYELPKSGDLKKNGGSVSLTISAPASGDSNNVYVKVYNSSDELASTVFIRKGEKATVSVPTGTTTIKVAYGSDWWGEDDMFGDEGTYTKLNNNGKSTFEFSSSRIYTLQLQIATSNGNVGSNNVSKDAF